MHIKESCAAVLMAWHEIEQFRQWMCCNLGSHGPFLRETTLHEILKARRNGYGTHARQCRQATLLGEKFSKLLRQHRTFLGKSRRSQNPSIKFSMQSLRETRDAEVLQIQELPQ